MNISIIVGFRNREIERIKKFLQSLENQTCRSFQLIFVDYGSDEGIAVKVKQVLEQYSFATYVYSFAKGWFWNRAHALNTGLLKAKGEVILFSDIDLIFPDNFLSQIMKLNYEKSFYTFSCYYLEKGMDSKSVHNSQFTKLKNHYVGLCAANREMVKNLGGFDEYYMHWGGEDDALYQKLEGTGNSWTRFSVQDYPILHQWHENHAPPFPTPWYLETINYLYLCHSPAPGINTDSNFGHLLKKEDRPLYSLIQNTNLFKSFELYGNPWLQFNLFLIGFSRMKVGELGLFEFPIRMKVPLPKGRKQIVVDKLNSIFSKLSFPYILKPIKKREPEAHTKERWLEFVTYFIGKNRVLIRDYYLLDSPERLALYFQKK